MHIDTVNAQSTTVHPHPRATPAGADYAFGDFALYPARKLLVRGETPVVLGGRAFDLLVALVARAGEVVGHHELVAAVWPHAVVEENGLRVHMSALRKALGEGPADQYVLTVPGRGYRFVKPVSASLAVSRTQAQGPRLGRLIGREAALEWLARGLAQARIATVTGAGGGGKSALALAYAAGHARRYPDGCRVVDFSAGQGPALAAIDSLRERQALLVLDNCEQALPLAAALAQRGAAASRLTVLATSRAPLGLHGEWEYRLPPLDLPAADAALDCRQALALSAIALFVERAEANSSRFALTPSSLPSVVKLCRALDGLPLALELAAARVEALGVEGLAARLDDILLLLTRSRRLAGPRHASLEAMLDAGHRLLDEPGRTLLRRLALFEGTFSRAAAERVCAFGTLGPAAVAPALAGLASASLLTAEREPGTTRYRLLHTTRRYARARLAASGEEALVARRVAQADY
ncbi:winged helix-turn-helix domain-containing protein [Massilia sp. HP4]|uniref:ATP-binding protein n=1 Tax=Massilia sp. HP4 TaxID=2562316 RepID=UPI0010BFB9D7|nr:winged helix-turn-helix domain-containing protein [Massilia sp. HP4]